ncbi:unnamed protein product, partial [Brassica oleracea var. botrytis]
LSFRWPTEGLYPSVATSFRHRFLASALSCFGLFHFLLASSPLFIVGLRPDQTIQTGGCGCPQLPWRDGDVVISPGGFAGVALRRCLRRSGQDTASTVSPLSPLATALVRTSPSCSNSSVLQASEGSWLLSSASLGVL